MTEPVDNLITSFAKAGATYISFHPDASQNVKQSLQLIHDNGCKAGLALNPDTPIDCLEEFLGKLDLVLLMSVNPGFAGQKFIPSVLPKIKKVRALINSKENKPLLEVDGGINLDNFKQIAEAGADIFVAGSAIFNHKGEYQKGPNRHWKEQIRCHHRLWSSVWDQRQHQSRCKNRQRLLYWRRCTRRKGC